MKRQVFLVGYRATGKTTVGKILANYLGWRFVDVDEEIEKYSSKTIKEIFQEEGEEKFRNIEAEVFRKLSFDENVVFSTGGGIVIKSENREILKKGFVVLLDVSVDTIVSRIIKDGNRPPLTNLPIEEEVKNTLEFRKKFYDEVFHLRVVNEGVSPEIVATLIKSSLPINFR